MSGIDPIWLLRGAEALVLVVGAAIAYASFRAFARSREIALALLGTGFVVVTVAAALAGVIYEVVTHDLLTAWSVSAALDCVGFSMILYSIVRPRTTFAAATSDDSPGARPP
ncbi:MAG: DUF7521 family protein [Thermoplasmata archaeon]